MKKKFLLFSILALAVFAIWGVSSASAHGWFGWGNNLEPEQVVERQSQMFESQAELLDISLEQVKEYWSEGKNIREIAEELGISDEDLQARFQTAQREHMQQELQILVENGVISQAQADRRLSFMEDNMVNGKFGHHMGGFMKGFGCPPETTQ